MLDEQVEMFAGSAGLRDMVLGLAAVSDRVATLIPRRRAAAGSAQQLDAMAFALLGLLSLRRTLWAVFAAQPSTRPDATAEAAPDRGEPPPRGLLR